MTPDHHLDRILRAAGSSLSNYTPYSQEKLRAAMAEVLAAEREACAKVAELHSWGCSSYVKEDVATDRTCKAIAAAIRSRAALPEEK